MPKRIQMRRTKGWRKPEGVVYVGRPSMFGNPFRHDDAEYAVKAFRRYARNAVLGRPQFGWRGVSRYLMDSDLPAEIILGDVHGVVLNGRDDGEFVPTRGFKRSLTLVQMPDVIRFRREIENLRGRDLACWCPLDKPCHADVLLELANR